MDQTSNPVTTTDSSGVREISASLDRLRDCKLRAAMRSGMDVVVNVGPKHPLKMPPSGNQQPVEALLSYSSDPPLRDRIGSRIGVRIASTPSAAKTSSNGPRNLPSRSWIRNLSGSLRPSR